MADRMPSFEDFRSFMEPVRRGEGAADVQVQLDRPGELVLPESHAGWVRLSFWRGDTTLGTLPAPEPGRQWDWQTLTERVAELATSRPG